MAKSASAEKKDKERGSSNLSLHRRARYDYEIIQSYDAGIALLGSEVKSARTGHANIAEGYCRFQNGELWLLNVNIAPYAPARENHDPIRPRKLLMHRRELIRLQTAMNEQPRTTVIPLRLHLSRGIIKAEIGLALGKRSYDKRDSIREREANLTMQRAVRHSVR